MRVTALLFARPRELAGAGSLDLDLPEGATAGDALAALGSRVPGLAEMRSRLRCAVDGEYAAWDTMLQEGSEVALIPPTAGG